MTSICFYHFLENSFDLGLWKKYQYQASTIIHAMIVLV
jgi:hypothetical protein